MKVYKFYTYTPNLVDRFQEEGIVFKNPSEMNISFSSTVDMLVVRIVSPYDSEY